MKLAPHFWGMGGGGGFVCPIIKCVYHMVDDESVRRKFITETLNLKILNKNMYLVEKEELIWTHVLDMNPISW